MKFKIVSLTLLAYIAILFSCATTGQKSACAKQKDTINGPGKIYWEDGSLKGKGSFKDRLKEGKWTLFYKDSGEKLAAGEYQNDRKTGEWTYFDKKGRKETTGSYKNGYKTGTWVGYYNTGEIEWKAWYVIRKTESGYAGLIEGTKTTYYKSGKVLRLEYHHRGIIKGRYQEFHENGNPREISWFINGKHNGKCNIYWENGNPRAQGFYKNNLKTGEWKTYYDNGIPETRGRYSIRKAAVDSVKKYISQKSGKWQFYSRYGLLQKEGSYRSGRESGLWNFFAYENRRRRTLAMRLTLKQGEANGPGIIYENGVLSGKGLLTGEVKGIYQKYVKKEPADEEAFIDVPPDNPEKDISYKWTGKWIQPQKNGKWTEYYPGGKSKKSEAFFTDNELNGAYREFYKNGKIKAKGEYSNGRKTGEWKVYNVDGTINKEESDI